MSQILVPKPRRSIERGLLVTSADVVVGQATREIWFRAQPGPLADGVESFLAASLIPAMRCGARRLFVEGSASPRLLEGADRIQDIFVAWHKGYERVEIDVGSRADSSTKSREVGCFFSAGVDSFYTVLRHLDEITTLVFVHGFDVRLDDLELRDTVIGGVRRAARALGKPLIEVETNVRELVETVPRVDWDLEAVGAALASVALLLAPRFRRVYIAAGNTYDRLPPRGSHPLLDPLWSTEAMEIVHDGCEASRLGKLELVVGSRAAARTLRVCWENRGGAYNCGTCEKCLRTMACLRALGSLDRVTTFSAPLDLDALAALRNMKEGARAAMEDALAHLEAVSRDRDLAEALRSSLRRT